MLKQWNAIAVGSDKTARNYLAASCLAVTLQWIDVLQISVVSCTRYHESMNSTRPVMADELTAGRLQLRAFELADLDALHQIFADPRTHTVGDGAFNTLEQTRSWLERRLVRRSQIGVTWYGVWLPNGPLIGNSGLFIGRTGDEPEFGFEIAADHQRRGYGTAAARAVVEEAHRAGFSRLWATVRPANIASMTVVSRVGFREHRTERDHKGELAYLTHP